ncbi:MAG: lysylphosphatidylglycerol synthase transmembrane domain-containing protein [Candidatus Diapherotrites archaeon]
MPSKQTIWAGISIVIILFLLSMIGLESITALLSQVPLEIWIIVLGLGGLAILLDALALWILLIPHGPISFFSYLPFYLVSWTVGSLLPGRLGDFSLALFSEVIQVDRKRIVAGVFLTKVLTLVAILVMGWVLVFRQILPPEWNTFLSGVTGMVSVALLILLIGGKWKSSLSRLFEKYFPKMGKGYRAWTESSILHRQDGIPIAGNLFLTFVRFLVVGISFIILLSYFGNSVDVGSVTGIVALSSISIFVPFTFNGVGIRESFIVTLLALIGVDATIAASVALVHLVGGYIIVILLNIMLWRTIRKIGENHSTK